MSPSLSLNKNETYKEKPVQKIESTWILSRQEPPSCIIILRNVGGRLGNILFMFASAYGLAKIHGCLLHISEHILEELRAIFQFTLTNYISKEHVDLLTNQNITSQYIDCQFDPKLMRPEAVKYFEIEGYWQSFAYFSQYLDEIRTLFSFKQSILRIIFPFINSILPNTLYLYKNMSFRVIKENIKLISPVIWIGIHVRRGDNLNSLQREKGYTVSTVEFFDKAIAYFTRRYQNRTLFIVVSDDKPYCRKIFQNRSNVIVTPDDFSPAADLAVISLCTDAIATCGSYSWWGAVLAGGIVLHDEKFPRRNSTIETICPRSSYYPPWFLFL
jgi:galactoside 2-L-fucosyltransferase 1/2